jgi:hypothetical protein
MRYAAANAADMFSLVSSLPAAPNSMLARIDVQ